MPKLSPEEYYWASSISWLRGRLQLSEEEFGRRFGVAEDVVKDWENGDSLPEDDSRRKVGDAFRQLRSQGEGPFDFVLKEKEVSIDLSPNGKCMTSVHRRRLLACFPTDTYLWEWYSDGEIDKVCMAPGTDGGTIRLGARMYKVQKFDDVIAPGTEIEVSMRAEFRNAFTAKHEWLAVVAREPTDLIIATVRFPPDRPPLEYYGSVEPPTASQEPVASLESKTVGDHVELVWRVGRPALNAQYVISWVW